MTKINPAIPPYRLRNAVSDSPVIMFDRDGYRTELVFAAEFIYQYFNDKAGSGFFFIGKRSDAPWDTPEGD